MWQFFLSFYLVSVTLEVTSFLYIVSIYGVHAIPLRDILNGLDCTATQDPQPTVLSAKVRGSMVLMTQRCVSRIWEFDLVTVHKQTLCASSGQNVHRNHQGIPTSSATSGSVLCRNTLHNLFESDLSCLPLKIFL